MMQNKPITETNHKALDSTLKLVGMSVWAKKSKHRSFFVNSVILSNFLSIYNSKASKTLWSHKCILM